MIYAAQGLGFFSKEGIELSIELSKGTGDAATLLAAGKGEFALTSPDAVMILVSKGANVVSVFTWIQGELNRLVVLEDSPFKEITDLRGKTIGIPFLGAAASYVLLRELKLSGMKEGEVNMVPVGLGPGAVEALIQRKVDALMTPSYGSVMYLSQTKGPKMREIPLKGRPIPTMVLAASKKMLETERAMVVGVARAMAKGILYTMANSSGAVEIMGKMYPELVASRDLVEFNTRYLSGVHICGEGKERPVGWHDPEAWSEAQKLYEGLGVIPKGVIPESCYANDLLKEINDFDRSEIERIARSGRPESVEEPIWSVPPLTLMAVLLLAVGVATIAVVRKRGSRTMSSLPKKALSP